jgi:hypothetical protein
MIKSCLFAAGILFAVAGCEKRDAAPTAAEKQAAAGAQAEAQKAEAAEKRAETAVERTEERADKAVDVAKEKADLAEDRAEATKDKAEELADKADLDEARDKTVAAGERADVDWKGPDEGWEREWVTFADGKDRTVEAGDYTIERDKDGTISAWRKTKQVAGDAFGELKDATLVTQVKAKLAADDQTRATSIDVDAEDHTVHLRGTVKSQAEAARAVRLALGTPGAEKVISHLKWDAAK